MNRFKSILLTPFAILVFLGLMVQTAVAGTVTSRFDAELAADAKAEAKASAVALAGTDITGKILLQEYRATASGPTKARMSKPTAEQIRAYGTIVRSAQEGQRVLANQVKTYQKLVVTAEKRVKVLKIKVKHADAKKKAFKKHLKKAQKKVLVLRSDKEWKYRPLLRLPRATCFENSGLRNNNEGQGFWYCVGQGEHNENELVMGWDPAESEARVVALVLPNGSVIDGCLNFGDWEINIDTVDYSQVIFVKSFVGLRLEISGAIEVSGGLDLSGEMLLDGVVCDTDEKHISISESAAFGPIVVEASDTKEALLIGERKVQKNLSLMASAKDSVEGAVLLREKGSLELSCDTPTSYNSPDASATAGSCVEPGQTTGFINFRQTNPNEETLPGSVSLNGGTPINLGNVAAGGFVSYQFPGLAPGNYSLEGRLTLPNGQVLSDTVSVTVPECEIPMATLSLDGLNDIDETDPNCEGTPQECESWTVFQAHIAVPTGISGTLRVDSDFGSTKFTSNGQKTITLTAGQHNPEIKLVAPTEVPAGGKATITVTFTPSKGKAPEPVSSSIVINETVTPPM